MSEEPRSAKDPESFQPQPNGGNGWPLPPMALSVTVAGQSASVNQPDGYQVLVVSGLPIPSVSITAEAPESPNGTIRILAPCSYTIQDQASPPNYRSLDYTFQQVGRGPITLVCDLSTQCPPGHQVLNFDMEISAIMELPKSNVGTIRVNWSIEPLT
jgi:hypothetical protein